jgi:hypothetical protein
MLAVDWDRHEARYVLGTTANGKVTIHAVGAVSLIDVSEGGSEPQPDLSGSLAAALTEEKVGRVPALVGVERSSIELLHFTLPPAKDSELPEMVAHQAMRESQLIGEQSVIDFVPIDGGASAPRGVIAAALAPDQRKRIQATCEAAGLKPSRMLLRPFAAASLFVRTASPSEETYLLVNRITDEVDLTIVVDSRPVFFRTVRMPENADEPQLTQRLLMEINRTLAAAPQTHLGGETIECIHLFGRADEHEELVERIRDDLFLTAKVFDPFEVLRVDPSLVPERSGRFVPLLGMLLDEAAGSHAVDFLHPREKPKPVDRKRIAAIAAVVLALVVLGVGYERWSKWSAIDRKYQAYREKLAKLNEATKKAKDLKGLVGAVEGWKARDVVWLDELRHLSLRLPSARDVVLSNMSMSTAQGGGGSVHFEGLMRSPEVLVNLERRIRDEYRQVRSKGVRERRGEKEYTWTFDTSLSIERRSSSAEGSGKDRRYVSHLPPEEQLLARRPPAKPSKEEGEDSEEKGPSEAPKPGEKPAKEQPGETLAGMGTAGVIPKVREVRQPTTAPEESP